MPKKPLKPLVVKPLTKAEVKALAAYGDIDAPEAFDWFEGVVPADHLTKADLWGVDYGVHRGRMSKKDWIEWMDEQDAEAEDRGEPSTFDYLTFPVIDPIVVTYDGGDHMHIWDGWHRSGLVLANLESQRELPALIGVLKPGFDVERSAIVARGPSHGIFRGGRGRS